jgi:hypothetical protein
MMGLGLGAHLGPGLSPISLEIRWILNADATPVLGVIYSWDDTQLWTDANPWKG